MHKTLLPFNKVSQLSKTDVAYATHDPLLGPFYRYAPDLKSFSEAIEDRKNRSYPREKLVSVLQEQYQPRPVQSPAQENVLALLQPDTFTIVTAHQPALFLGPLFFLYKAMTTIGLAEAAAKQTGVRVVPVFVLGSEDHDLGELNHINLFGKKLEWNPGTSGAVGAMSTSTILPLIDELSTILGTSETASALTDRIRKAYTGSSTFAEATHALLHDLFGRFGLVVLNMSHPALKRLFIPFMQQELVDQPTFQIVGKTIESLSHLGFKTQASPREINLFYMQPGSRERIVLESGEYKVLNTDIRFSKDEILAELDCHPERFSPNVLLRPMYQELVLPNLAYVGGGGELAYWLERKAQFDHFDLPFPMLVRRHSVMWMDRDVLKRLDKFGFTPEHFFADPETLVRDYVQAHTDVAIEFDAETAAMQEIFNQIEQKAAAVDPTLVKAVRADAVKNIASLEQWKSRLVRAEKQKHEVTLNQIRALKEKLFPGGGLQERTDNFLPYFLKYGDGFLDELKTQFEPLEDGFLVLEER
jgi:bacillithiol biosynthesis cysteine-adding enzyme BshC